MLAIHYTSFSWELTHQINPIWLVSIWLPTCLWFTVAFHEILFLSSRFHFFIAASFCCSEVIANPHRRLAWRRSSSSSVESWRQKFSPLHHSTMRKIDSMMNENSYPRWLRVGNSRRRSVSSTRIFIELSWIANKMKIESFMSAKWNDFIGMVRARRENNCNFHDLNLAMWARVWASEFLISFLFRVRDMLFW